MTTDEALPQNQYLYEVAKHMKETSDRLEKKLDTNTELTQSILIQATKTNGRVNGLEKREEDDKNVIPNIQKQVNRHENFKWWIVGASVGVGLLGTYAINQVVNGLYSHVDQKIQDSQSVIIKSIEDQLKITGSAPNFTNSVSVH